jgi:two-component system C4-dicarboxylate transport response regulator DctD
MVCSLASITPAEIDRRSILIVEDERSTRRAMAQLLSCCGYRPEAFESAEAALLHVEGGFSPCIALVDLDLPGMNGLEFIRKLIIMDPHIFPILVTATDEFTLATRLKELPVAYLRKPLNFNLLLNLIEGPQGEPMSIN